MRRFGLPKSDTKISMCDRKISSNPVRVRRLTREWSQADLAERAGISRAAVSAIEGGRLSPSVATALVLAAIFECSVEELFGGDRSSVSNKSEWAWTPNGESSRYWEAEIGRRRMLYPVEATGLNPTPHDGVQRNGVLCESGSAKPESTLVMASCDPAAGLLAAEYARASGYRLLVFPRSGRAALDLLGQRLIHVAGLHYSTEEQPERNAGMVRTHLDEQGVLLRMAKWETGVALAPEDRSSSAEGAAQRPLRWAAREPGSAARECMDELLGLRPFSGREVNGHSAVAEAVRSGWAEAGVCVRFSTAEAGLNFCPSAPKPWIYVSLPPFRTIHAFGRWCGCCGREPAAALSVNCQAMMRGKREN